MGLIEFCILCVVVLVIAAIGNWAIDTFATGHPPLINKLIWGVAVAIILFALLQATGILGHDVRIPHV